MCPKGTLQMYTCLVIGMHLVSPCIPRIATATDKNLKNRIHYVTLRSRQMATILQTTFSNAYL